MHAIGACRLSTLQELCKQYDVPYPHGDLDQFREVVAVTKPQPSLTEFLKPFVAIRKLIRWGGGGEMFQEVSMTYGVFSPHCRRVLNGSYMLCGREHFY